jgi:hypothetical protein
MAPHAGPGALMSLFAIFSLISVVDARISSRGKGRLEVMSNRVMGLSEIETEAGVQEGTVDFIEGFPESYNRMCRCKICGGKKDFCGAIPVKVAVVLNHLHIINDVDRSCDVDILITSQWIDDRLTKVDFHGRIEEGEIGYPIWTPNLEVRNQRAPAEELESEMRLNPQGTPPGTIRTERRFAVTVVDKFDEWAFPFDGHIVNITVASFAYSAAEVDLKIWGSVLQDPDNYPENPEWSVENITLTEEKEKSHYAEVDSYVNLHVKVDRYYQSAVMNLIMPVMAIVLFATTAFFVKSDELGDRINVASIGFLTIMAYTYVVAEALPKVSYILWIHWFVIISYATVLWVTVLVIWHHVQETKQAKAKPEVHPDTLRKINKYAGYVTPFVYVVAIGVLFIFNYVCNN